MIKKRASLVSTAVLFGTLSVGGLMSLTQSSGAMAAGSDDRCTPLVVRSLKPSSGSFNGSRYRVFVSGQIDVAANKPYLGSYDGRRPAQYAWHAQARGQRPISFTGDTVTQYMTKGYPLRIVADKPVDVPATEDTVILNAYVFNFECSDPRQRTVRTSYTYDLRPLRQGQSARLVGRPRISYAGPPRAGGGAPRPRS